MVTPRVGSARMSARTSTSRLTATDRPVSAAVSRTTVSSGCSPWSTAPPGSDQAPGVPDRGDARTSSTRPDSSLHSPYAAILRSGSRAGVTAKLCPEYGSSSGNCQIPDTRSAHSFTWKDDAGLAAQLHQVTRASTPQGPARGYARVVDPGLTRGGTDPRWRTVEA